MNEAQGKFTAHSRIQDIINDPAFDGYGRLLFPVQKNYMQGATLGTLNLSWYTNIRPEESVAVVNDLYRRAAKQETIFYDIYTEEEKAAAPEKRDTGLVFFKGKPGAKLAVLCAGGGFRYVGAIHDSFPHALALSKKSYNAFALIYRLGGEPSLKDLARAIAFIHENQDRLEPILAFVFRLALCFPWQQCRESVLPVGVQHSPCLFLRGAGVGCRSTRQAFVGTEFPALKNCK